MSAIKMLGDSAKRHLLLIAFVIVSLLNAYYLNTYPINIAAFDYPNYAGMIFSGASNLIHASGYVWAIRFIFDTLGIPNGADIYDLNCLYILQLTNFCLHLLNIAICSFMCKKVFGRLPAVFLCLAWGGSLFFMGGVNSIAPDWLQGELLAIALLSGLWAFNVKNHAKITLYIFSVIALTFSYLVKFNSLVVAPIIAILIIFDSKDWIWKVVTTFVACAASAALVLVFIESFHYPTTGTRQLSYDHAWVLIDAIPGNYIIKAPETLGINTLRWKALGTILPPDYFRAAAYQNVNWGAPKEIKAPFLEKYEYLMNASRAELIDFTKKNELPENFIMRVSAIPGYYYIGLPQTDTLGIAVYKESLLTIPFSYAEKLLTGWIMFFNGYPTQLTPFKSNSLGLSIGNTIDADNNVRVSPPEGRIAQHMMYWNPSEKVKLQGMSFFEWLNILTPPSWVYALFALVSIVAIRKTQSKKTIFHASLLILTTILLVSSSLMLIGVRFKEMLALQPIVSIFLSLGLASCIQWWQQRQSSSNTFSFKGEPT